MQENTTHRRRSGRPEEDPAARRLDPPRRQRREEGRRDPAGGQAPAAAGHRPGGLGRHQDACRCSEKCSLGLFFTGDELVMPGEPLRAGAHLQLQPLHAARAGRAVRLRAARLRHRARQPGGDARGAAARGGGMRRDRHFGRRVGGRRRLRQAGGRGRRQAADVAHRHEAGAAAGVRLGAKSVLHRPAGQPGVELRHLPDLRAAVPAAHPGPDRDAPEEHRGARGLRLARARRAARVPARKMERAGRAGSLPDAGLGGAHLHVLGRTGWWTIPPAQPIRKGDLVRFLPYSELYW